MIKATLKEDIDLPIDIFICDKRTGNIQDSILGTISENLFAEKIVWVIYLANNLVDRDFSRSMTLYQNFKKKRLMKEDNIPYSITCKFYMLFLIHIIQICSLIYYNSINIWKNCPENLSRDNRVSFNTRNKYPDPRQTDCTKKSES